TIVIHGRDCTAGEGWVPGSNRPALDTSVRHAAVARRSAWEINPIRDLVTSLYLPPGPCMSVWRGRWLGDTAGARRVVVPVSPGGLQVTNMSPAHLQDLSHENASIRSGNRRAPVLRGVCRQQGRGLDAAVQR